MGFNLNRVVAMASRLHWADYLILVVFLAISLGIGIYHSLTGGRQKTTAEFIMANRRLKVIPTAISVLLTYRSAILLLGMTAEMYGYGIQYLLYFILSAIVALLFVERIIVPWLYPLKLVSVFDYLEQRYMSKTIRIFGASIGISTAIMLMGVAMYAPSAALESATGLPLSVSIPAMAVVAVIYTALGGMRAVIWTDVFQCVIMIAGMVAILVKGLVMVGGITNLFSVVGKEGRLIWTDVRIDPRERNTVWSLMIGMGLYWINAYGLTQAAVQRYSAVDRLSKARTTMLIVIPPLIIIDAIAGFIGLVVLAYYSIIKCDPLANKDVGNHNMLLPYFVVNIFADSPGFAGLFLATLYGGTLSTLSSLLSGSAANCWEDILKWKLGHLKESKKTLINKLLVVLFGVLSSGVAFLSASLPGPITQVMIAMYSSVSGPLVAFFILGGVSKHANWKGALLGGIVGLLTTLWLSIGSMTVRHKHPPLPPVSVDNCFLGNSNYTYFPASLNYTADYMYFGVSDGIWTRNNWNQTTEVMPDVRSRGMQLEGLENFYAISYLWFFPIGAIVTAVIGIIASFIMRDRDLEAKVDERLLLRIHCCSWSGENENQEYLVNGNRTSLLETKGLQEQEDGLLKGFEMTDSSKTENRFSQGNQK